MRVIHNAIEPNIPKDHTKFNEILKNPPRIFIMLHYHVIRLDLNILKIFLA